LSIDSREFTDLLEEQLQILIDFEEYESCALVVKLQNKLNKQKV
jgi:acyl carrier protein